MIFVSVTRLRLRSLRFLPWFLWHASRSLRQCRRMPGFREGSVGADRKLTFWTMTLWEDQSAMRAYMSSGAHLKAMPRLLHWCDEASVVHWTDNGALTPGWREAADRMRTEGRVSKVRNASQNHARLRFATPRAIRTTRITPARARQ